MCAYKVTVRCWNGLHGIDAAGLIDSVGEPIKDSNPERRSPAFAALGTEQGAPVSTPSWRLSRAPQASQPFLLRSIPLGRRRIRRSSLERTLRNLGDFNSTAVISRQVFGSKSATTAITGLAYFVQSGKYKLPAELEF
ncbi:MAG: hypothetical protein M1819_002838 [Sarea resinae]|nr:MAG: hypothetical protein M1819_002838 [Sarea resinae]